MPGVPAVGAARGCGWPAREKGGEFEDLSLEWSRIDEQKIESLNHVKLSPKSEGIVNVIVSPMKSWLCGSKVSE